MAQSKEEKTTAPATQFFRKNSPKVVLKLTCTRAATRASIARTNPRAHQMNINLRVAASRPEDYSSLLTFGNGAVPTNWAAGCPAFFSVLPLITQSKVSMKNESLPRLGAPDCPTLLPTEFAFFHLFKKGKTARRHTAAAAFFPKMLCLLWLLFLGVSAQAAVYFVKTDGSDSNTGLSWAQGFLTLQHAINTAVAGDEIWVKTGTYKPTAYPTGCTGCSTERDYTFHLKDGVAVYGGFDGTETMRDERDWAANPTILSGDIGTVGDDSDNCYHVVLSVSDANTTELDGFTIQNGNADMVGSITVETKTIEKREGGGAQCNSSSLKTNNCIFASNKAREGAGFYSLSSNPTVINSHFSNNTATLNGGGMAIYTSPAIVTDCVFSENSAANNGAGFYISGSIGADAPLVTGCKFLGNATTNSGGGMRTFQSAPAVVNCLFAGNTAAFGGGLANSNVSDPPSFTNCTFTGNKATTAGGGVFTITGSILTLKNCLIWNNSINFPGSSSENINAPTGTTTITYSLIQNKNPSGAGNLNGIPNAASSNYPEFVTPLDPATAPSTAGDFHITNCSPVLNLGTNDGAPATDLFGNPRPFNSGVADIGIHELQADPDATPPSITCPANATVAANASCQAILDNYSTAATASDNCPAGASISQSPAAGATLSAGNQTVTLTATDVAGNSSTCSFQISVADQTAPIGLSCPSNSTVAANSNCQFSLTNFAAAATPTDNCTASGDISKTQNPTAGTLLSAGNQTVTLTATDEAGNSSTCSFQISVADQTAPSITCPSNTTVSANGGSSFSMTDFASSTTAADNCTANPTESQSPSVGTSMSIGNHTVTMTATDAAGLTATCTFTLTVEVGCLPTGSIWYVAADAASGGNGGSWACAYQNLQDAINAASSGHEIWVKTGTYKPTAYPTGCTGCTTERDYTFHLNSGVKIFGGFDGTETMRDEREWEANPTILSGDIGAAGDDSDNCYHVVLSVSDANTTELDGFTIQNGNADGVGSITVETKAIENDEGGGAQCNSSSFKTNNCIFTNNQAFNGAGFVNVSSSTSTVLNSLFSNNTATNFGGGMGIYSSRVTLTDCIFSENSGENGAGLYINGTGGASTSPVVTRCKFLGNTASELGGGMRNFQSSTTAINCLFAGNTAENGGGAANQLFANSFVSFTNCTFTGNESILSGGGIYYSNMNSITTIKNCISWNNRAEGITGSANSSLAFPSTAPNISYSLFQNQTPSGTGNLDGITNAALSNYPDFATPLDPADAPSTAGDFQIGACSPVLNFGTNSGAPSTDLFGNPRPFNGGVADIGVHELQSAGDETPPSITCPSNSTVAANSNCQFSLTNFAAATTPTDNCTASGDISKTQNPTAGTLLSAGNQTVTLTATDAAGNSSTCSFQISVADQTAPTGLSCPSNSTVAANSNCQFSLTNFAAAATPTDNCTASGDISKTQNPTAGTLLSTGNQTVTLTATDAAGNSSTCSFQISVADQTAPTGLACPSNSTVAANSNCQFSLTNFAAAATPTDNCTASGDISKTQNPSAGTLLSAGNQTVTLTATDAAGNSSTCSFQISVADQTAPNISCPTSSSVQADGNGNYLLPNFATATTSSDNCTANPSETQNPTAGTTLTVGNHTITMTATDAAGNTSTCEFDIEVEASCAISAQISAPADFCPNLGATVFLTATGSTEFQWESGETTDQIEVAPTMTTTYVVTVGDGTGCTATASHTLIVKALPPAAIAGPSPVCFGDEVTLTASGGIEYEWLHDFSSDESISLTAYSSFIYVVQVTGANGCTATKAKNLIVKPLPTVVIAGDDIICEGQNTKLTTSNFNSQFLWNTGATSPNITVQPMENTTYTVSVTNINSCVGTASMTVNLTGLCTCENDNVLENNGFESGFAKWTRANLTQTQVPSEVHSGLKAMKICGSSGAGSQKKPALPTQTWLLKFWGKTDGGSSTRTVGLQFLGASNVVLLETSMVVETNEYTLHELQLTAPEGSKWVKVKFEKTLGSGCLFVDDFCLIQVVLDLDKTTAPPTLQVVVEPDFLNFESEENAASELEIFPNPTDNLLNFRSLDGADLVGEVSVFNAVGQLILRQEVNLPEGGQGVLSVEALPQGAYFLVFKNEKIEFQPLPFFVF